jgi:hypothetical protein
MTKQELLDALRALKANESDPEENHVDADDLLLKFINDPEVTEAFNALHKWYA